MSSATPEEMAAVSVPQTVVEQATAFMYARTIAFLGHHDVDTRGEPIVYGSGVLLQIADTRFIATAYHVCESFLEEGWSVFIAGNEETLVPLNKASIRHAKKGDIALIPLTEDAWSVLSVQRQFTRLSEVAVEDPTDEAGGVYCAFGYPTAKSSTDHGARLHKMIAEHAWGLPYAKTKRPIEGFDPELHIAIEFQRVLHGSPRGMSGGGIWRVHQGGVPAAGWTPGDIKLVAIEHTHGITDRALVGTRAGYLSVLARNYDPSLEPVLKLAWPGKARTLPERLVRED
jgi:hypothetical protein